MSKSFSPRPYQAEHIKEILAYDGPDTALFYGVGGGKTSTSMVIASEKLSRGDVDKVVVITPQTQLMDQFEDTSEKWCGYHIEGGPKGKFLSFVRRSDVRGTGKALETFLTTPSKGQAIVISAKTLIDVWERVLNEFKTLRVLFVIDECHHINENTNNIEVDTKMSKVISGILGYLKTNNIPRSHFQRLFLSATPYRTDLLDVYPKGHVKECFKRLVSLMVEEHAPKYLKYDYIAESSTATRIHKVFNQWLEDGMPVTHIKLPGKGTIQENQALVAELTATFSPYTKVINSYSSDGVESLNLAKKMTEAWMAGKLPYAEIPKIYISINRMIEGVDIPSICCTYIWGISKSILQVEQTLGRSMRERKKSLAGKGYPEEWLDQSKLVFVVGAIPEDGVSRYILRMCCHMENLCLVSALSRVIYEYDGLERSRKEAAREFVENYLDDQQMVEAKEVWELFIRYWDACTVDTPKAFHPSRNPEKFLECVKDYYTLCISAKGPSEEFSEYLKRAHVLVASGEEKEIELPEEINDDNILAVLNSLIPQLKRANNHLTGIKISEIHECVLKEVQAIDMTRPKKVEEVLARVFTYYGLLKAWPELDSNTRDNQNPLWSFADYSRHFDNLRYKIVEDFSQKGVRKDLYYMHRVVLAARRSQDPELQSRSRRKTSKGTGIRIDIKRASNDNNRPVGVYYPGAPLATVATDFKVFDKLSEKFGQAQALKILNRLGGFPDKTLRSAYEKGLDSLLALVKHDDEVLQTNMA